jgi:hypothetical protein
MLRASLMGICIPWDNFESIDLIREMENSRSNLREKMVAN